MCIHVHTCASCLVIPFRPPPPVFMAENPLFCEFLMIYFNYDFSQQLVGISRVSGFLVGIMNKTISRVLQTQGHNFTDKRWFINKILRRIVCFQRKYKKFGSLAIIHFLQFPTCRYKSSLIRPSWYHQHTWTNTRTYCTDKNIYQQNTEKNRMFPTPNTKISARSAHSQSVICFQLGIIVKKGHAINCPWKTGDSAPSTPDKGSVRNFNGRISFYHC